MLELVNSQYDSANEPEIILGEDDYGYAGLIIQNLKRAGVKNNITHFRDGEKILNFLFRKGKLPHRQDGKSYIAILDVRMPNVDGIEVLRKIKGDDTLKSIPTFIMSSTDDPEVIDICHVMGCSKYIVKPKNYDQLKETIFQLGYHLNEEVIPAQKRKSPRQAM
jgi:CheY-like chemotaxis protein